MCEGIYLVVMRYNNRNIADTKKVRSCRQHLHSCGIEPHTGSFIHLHIQRNIYVNVFMFAANAVSC